MTILHIKLFGGFHVRDVAAAADVKVTPNLQHLLAYLLLFRHRAYARDVLMELFWGDHDEAHARACLNTALWRLRGLLEPPGRVEKGHFLLTTAAGEVSFNAGGGAAVVTLQQQLLVEELRLAHGGQPQLGPQHLGAGVVLLDGLAALAVRGVEAHQVAVDVLAQRVAEQDEPAAAQRVAEAALGGVIIHQVVERGQVHLAEALALAQGPIGIDALQQVAAIEGQPGLQLLGVGRPQGRGGPAQGRGHQPLELGHVDQAAAAGVEAEGADGVLFVIQPVGFAVEHCAPEGGIGLFIDCLLYTSRCV